MKTFSILLVFISIHIHVFGQNSIQLISTDSTTTIKHDTKGSIYIHSDTISRKLGNGGLLYFKVKNTTDKPIQIPIEGTCWNDALIISRFSPKYQLIQPKQEVEFKIKMHVGKYKRRIHKSGFLNVLSYPSGSIIERISIRLRFYVSDK